MYFQSMNSNFRYVEIINYVCGFSQNSVILGGVEQEGDYDLTVRENEKQNILEFWFNNMPSLKVKLRFCEFFST